ncbi:hypothetical protein GA0115255_124963 [Streptomyces sp. Ncost-T6T-2b]|nr:hypothetical protein GA0115255_124963 [Streptomyces sp. Ncost-T6T-2b]
MKEFTVCGVFAASIENAMSPWLVVSDIVYFAFLSIFIAGSGALLSLSEGSGVGVWLAAASLFLSLSSSLPATTNALTPTTATTATEAATIAVMRLVLRRASSRRFCWRSNFSRASCRRRCSLLDTGWAPCYVVDRRMRA